MPLQGTHEALKQAAKSVAYRTLRERQLPKLPEGNDFPDDNIDAVADAISEAVVQMLDHILANGEVAGGIPVAVSGTAASQTGATTSNGKIV